LKHFREIVVARTPEEAVKLRQAAGTRGLYIAGGTMVVPLAVKAVEVLVDISRLEPAGRSPVGWQDGEVSMGATATLGDLVTPRMKAHQPLIYDAVRRLATPIIRNVATVGGALAVAHLPSDLAVALLAADASIDLVRDQQVTTSLEDLLASGWLKGSDLILKVKVPGRRRWQGQHFAKFGRNAIDVALVNVGVCLDLAGGKIERLRVVVGQTSTRPVLLKEVGEAARGKQVATSLIEDLARQAAASVKPRSDFRASGDYRAHLVEVLVARSLAAALANVGV
jgi:CO/xanthine dehydrogenase FAD-binding subunit